MTRQNRSHEQQGARWTAIWHGVGLVLVSLAAAFILGVAKGVSKAMKDRE